MKILPILFAAALLAPLSAAGAAAAAQPPRPQDNCTISVRPDQGSWVISGFDPFSNSAAEGIFSVNFTNTGTAACSFNPAFELSQPPFGLARENNNGHRIDYVLVDITAGVEVTPLARRPDRDTDFNRISLEPNQTQTRLFRFAVDTGSITRDGMFAQDVILVAQDGRFTTVGAAPVVLAINVLPSARMSLAGTYSRSEGRAVVDLGEMNEGRAPVLLQLNVSSTGGYDLTVTSMNQGQLRLGQSDWTVPYGLAIGGNRIDLSGTATLTVPERGGFRVDRMPIDVFVGDLTNRRAGTYSDVISVAVAAR